MLFAGLGVEAGSFTVMVTEFAEINYGQQGK